MLFRSAAGLFGIVLKSSPRMVNRHDLVVMVQDVRPSGAEVAKYACSMPACEMERRCKARFSLLVDPERHQNRPVGHVVAPLFRKFYD